MELGVGHALTSFLDESGVPTMAQQTAIICPQSLMGPVEDGQRRNLMATDGMGKYDEYVDRESAYEVLEGQRETEAKEKALADERAQFEKEKADFEKQKAKEEAAAQKQKEKEAAAVQKQKEKEAAAAQKKKEKDAERRRNQIERSLINTGAQVLKRGLLNTLFK